MNIRKGQQIDIKIDKAAYGGLGLVRINGFVVFVQNAVPGDRLRIQICKKKRTFAVAKILELLEPSQDRVTTPCVYFDHCGGCQWQHVRYEAQLRYKKAHITESLERIGGLKDIVVHDVIPSENVFNYRNKMEFSFSDKIWIPQGKGFNQQDENNFALGLHVSGTYDKVFDADACLLQKESGNEILREIKKYVKDCDLPVYGLKTHKGFWRYLVLRHSEAFNDWLINLVTFEERSKPLELLADRLHHAFTNIRTVVNNINTKKASIAFGERQIILSGDGQLLDKIGPYTFHISANSFFQTNSPTAKKLYDNIIQYAELRNRDTVLDLYSGTGTIPIYMADSVQKIIGFEVNPSAIKDAQINCKQNSIQNCTFICGDIRKELSNFSHRPDVIIIDPPRSGMHGDVLRSVLALSPRKIIYVSCNPTTLARDLSRMIRDHEVVEIQPVDMFPHTYHIEAVAKLHLRKKV